MARSPTFTVNLLGFTVITSFAPLTTTGPTINSSASSWPVTDWVRVRPWVSWLPVLTPAATVGQEPSAIRQARADRMDEIMQTVGASLMGVTMSCARCHNHKFDPITIHDYYSMTAVFQDIEFGSRYPEFSKDHPRKQSAQGIWKGIAQNRNKIREKTKVWEEDWGAYKEIHWDPVEAVGLRINFWSGYAGLDEVEIFGLPGESVNLAHESLGTTVKTDIAFAQQEDAFPVGRVIDGKFERSVGRQATSRKRNRTLGLSLPSILRSSRTVGASAPTENITTRPIIFSKRTSLTSINSLCTPSCPTGLGNRSLPSTNSGS